MPANNSKQPLDTDVISASKALEGGNAVLVDVRSPGEYAGGHAVGAISMPLDHVTTRAAELPKDRPVYVICQSGGRSQQAATALRSMGYENVTNVTGGTSAWKAAGLPTQRESATEAEMDCCFIVSAIKKLFRK
ncbi:MAG TPA: rhodanese-like domain-containing protein [Capsulimonadaceae bacterium]|jgi:rhodanese-related sulfurtransferase